MDNTFSGKNTPKYYQEHTHGRKYYCQQGKNWRVPSGATAPSPSKSAVRQANRERFAVGRCASQKEQIGRAKAQITRPTGTVTNGRKWSGDTEVIPEMSRHVSVANRQNGRKYRRSTWNCMSGA